MSSTGLIEKTAASGNIRIMVPKNRRSSGIHLHRKPCSQNGPAPARHAPRRKSELLTGWIPPDGAIFTNPLGWFAGMSRKGLRLAIWPEVSGSGSVGDAHLIDDAAAAALFRIEGEALPVTVTVSVVAPNCSGTSTTADWPLELLTRLNSTPVLALESLTAAPVAAAWRVFLARKSRRRRAEEEQELDSF